ncbi:STAS domain-containing protein [Massilia aerilata]|uniref:STAS domain-containing protein n=1 Tax=Massilia aerilata TaxID=453817 RepID=A0ABW0S3R4_9BURK
MTDTSYFPAIAELVQEHRGAIRAEWEAQLDKGVLGSRRVRKEEQRSQCDDFLGAFAAALRDDSAGDIDSRGWSGMRVVLDDVSSSRAKAGSTPSETATFVFSVKQPIFAVLRAGFADRPAVLAAAFWALSQMLDKLGLYTVEVFQRGRDQIVVRQQQELLELSTPVIQLWDGVLALPLIGTLDSMRAQVVMENVLQKIVDSGATIAIIDITGVPTVDTLVAQHLMKTIAAARLMGADCIISGIRPQIAQTIVHLGVDLQNVTTKATLADAFLVALERTGTMGIARTS